MKSVPTDFPEIEFAAELRPSQNEVVEIAMAQLSSGERSLHIVAPPGSGKTVLGLYLWACCIKKPCLVLSPNSAIQAQWAARIDLFRSHAPTHELVSTNTTEPGLLTSLTYQSVTMPTRQNEDIERQAIELWCDKLIEAGEAIDDVEAMVWINDLQTHNIDYYTDRLRTHCKKIRDEVAIGGDSFSLLHSSSVDTLKSVADLGLGMLILDECHHLVGHWGRVLSGALQMLGDPIVIGLTATPPELEGKDLRDVERYQSFFGPIDYEVPVPAVVKDGYLAPYQDLAFFVRPTSKELRFVASADNQLDDIVESLCADSNNLQVNASNADDGPSADTEEAEDAATTPRESANLITWLTKTLSELRLPTGIVESWKDFSKRDPAFSLCGRQFLCSRNLPLPDNVPSLSALESIKGVPQLEYWVTVLDRYVRHFLRRSPKEEFRQLGEEVTRSLRLLGIQITDTGVRACSSPVSRVLAYSTNKAAALIPILKTEMDDLNDSIRAVVVTDFERSSAVSAELKELMDDETGGAIAAFKTLLTDKTTDRLDPILVTGSTVLIDDDIEEEFLRQCRRWIETRGLNVTLESKQVEDFHLIVGGGRDWSPRNYVAMITSLFQNGLTKCLIGTRGLLGEGWDANKINVLIDLTTVTTSMSINQLRGRSFRLDPTWSSKLANNWDVVCIAPEFKKGFDDYGRFKRKHANLYGVTDDGAIEKGVGHVHPAFTDIQPEGLESSMSVLNAEMLERSGNRDHSRKLWKIGSPYASTPVRAVEAKMSGGSSGFPPFSGSRVEWNDQTLTRAIAQAVIASLVETGKIASQVNLHDGKLPGGYIRVFIENANETEGEIFATAMREILGPLDNPRYVIERIIETRTDTLFSKILPEIVGKYFRKSNREVAMLHALPNALAKNKSIVQVFEKHWNLFVSPGAAIYVQRGEGQDLLQRAKDRATGDATTIHEKEIFL